MNQEYVVTQVNVPDYLPEKRVINALLSEPSLREQASDLIKSFDEKYFTTINHQVVWDVMQKQIDKNFYPSAAEFIEELYSDPNYPEDVIDGIKKEWANAATSYECMAFISKGTLEVQLKELKDRYERRKLASELPKLAQKLVNPQVELKDVCDQAQDLFSKVDLDESQQAPLTEGMMEICSKVLLRIQDKIAREAEAGGEPEPEGLQTGFPMLDALSGGLRPGTYNIIAARPGIGKTTLALNIMTHIARNLEDRKPVVFFSLEMSKEDIVKRIICSIGGVSQACLERGAVTNAQWVKIVQGIKAVGISEDNDAHKLLITQAMGMSASQIFAEARRLAKRYGGLSLIVIDYVQIIRPEKGKADNVNQQLKETNDVLFWMCKELQTPAIVLSQLNRDIEHRNNKEPNNADLRDSGSLEAVADLIACLWTTKSSEEKPQWDGKGLYDTVYMKLTKNRHGKSGDTIDLLFNGGCYQFKEQSPMPQTSYGYQGAVQGTASANGVA